MRSATRAGTCMYNGFTLEGVISDKKALSLLNFLRSDMLMRLLSAFPLCVDVEVQVKYLLSPITCLPLEMPGRKKGRQRGNASSKAQRAMRWDDALREARVELAHDRRGVTVRRGDAAPPRVSLQGYRSLTTLLSQRVSADREEEMAVMTNRVTATNVAPEGARLSREPSASARFGRRGRVESSEHSTDNRPRKMRTLLALCISQIGRDFLEYSSEDDALVQMFHLLPDACLSRLSRAASANGTVSNCNIALLCNPSVTSLWLRGRFSDQGASSLLPELRGSYEGLDRSRRRRDDHTAAGVAEKCGRAANAPVQGRDPVVSCGPEASGEEDWETADDRIQGWLKGGVSLTSLDLSSPLMTADFVTRLATRIPVLRRLGLRGSLGVIGGPAAVCDHVPRLFALRELDVSHCSWFCDLCLRRLAHTLARGQTDARDEAGVTGGTTLERMTLEYADEMTNSWGAAGERGSRSRGSLGIAGPAGGGVHGATAGAIGSIDDAGYVPRFRTFTVSCAHTAVTNKGAREAESTAPGLLVLLEEKAAAGVLGRSLVA